MAEYKYNKRWRLNHPDRRNSQKKRCYDRHEGDPRKRGSRWVPKEIKAIMSPERPFDSVLVEQLGRSMRAVHAKREEVKEAMSLWERHCQRCSDPCCAQGGTPILTLREKAFLGEMTVVRDCFTEVLTSDGSYFIIGRNRRGGKRSPATEPCPYLDAQGRCGVYSFAPLSCRIYPVMPVHLTPASPEPLWVVDSRCPISISLRKEYLALAKILGDLFLGVFGPARLSHYVEHYAPWVIEYRRQLRVRHGRLSLP